MEVADRIGNREGSLQIQMQRGVAQGCQINQGDVTVGGLKGQGKVDRDGGGAAPSLCVDYREDFAARAVFFNLALAVESRTNASSKSVVVVGRSMNSRAPAHGTHDHLRLGHAANCKHGALGDFMAQ